MKKNILITGVAGFIGSSLGDELVKKNEYNIIGIDNFDDFYCKEIKQKNLDSLESKNFSFREIDIQDLEKLRDLFAEYYFEQVIHLAANAGVQDSRINPIKYYNNNVSGLLNILELCREYKVKKFIFASSSSVYGQSNEDLFHEEMAINKPISPYAATKVSGENLCYTYSHLYNIQMVILRFFTVYGPRQRPDLAIHKFSKLINSGKEIEIYGDGKTGRDYTYITDTIQGIIAAMNYDKSPYEIFNLGESKVVELNYLVELLEKNLGKKAIRKYCDKQPGDVDFTNADISKANNILGYNPKVNIEEGISLFVDWFLSNQN